MEFWQIIFSPEAKEVSSTAILVGVVISIFTGLLVPGRTHKRELATAARTAEEHRLASEKKDIAIGKLLDQNAAMLAGIRIADKYYGDFLPAVDEFTKPRKGVSDVGA